MTKSTRIAGLLLMLACIALPIIIVDYIRIMSGFDAGGDPSITDRAEFAKGAYAAASRGWIFEILAVAFVATAGLILMNRESRAGWALAAVGATITIPMYGIMIGGYGEVFERSELNAELFVVLRSMTLPFFYVGQGLMTLGLGLALGLEALASNRLLPSWLLLLGCVANTLGGGVFILLHFSLLDSFAIAGPFALLGFALTALLGARLMARPD